MNQNRWNPPDDWWKDFSLSPISSDPVPFFPPLPCNLEHGQGKTTFFLFKPPSTEAFELSKHQARAAFRDPTTFENPH